MTSEPQTSLLISISNRTQAKKKEPATEVARPQRAGNKMKPVHKSDGQFGVRRLVAALHSEIETDRGREVQVRNKKRRPVARSIQAPH
jgi:hypothetical protein